MFGLMLYIDPGTGPYLFQLLIAGLLATVFFFKNIKNVVFDIFVKVKSFFKTNG